MCSRLLEDTGVAVIPGIEFGRKPEELAARIAYVDFNGKAALDAVASIPESQPLSEEFLKTYCGKVIKAIDRMCDWVKT